MAKGTISALTRLERKNLGSPDDTRTVDKGKVEIATVGSKTLGRATFQPGWKWSESVKPVVNTDSCEMAHLGYMISGRMHVVMDDGTETECAAGDVVSIPPGHDAWIVGNEPCVIVDFMGLEEYGKPG
jgi:mannose-6-phosphate isomerase-like protein (cupin superfamily)